MEDIKILINQYYNLDILAVSRKRTNIIAKSIFCYTCYKYLGIDYSEISRFLKMQPSNVRHHVINFDTACKTDSYLKRGYDELSVILYDIVKNIANRDTSIIEANLIYHKKMINIFSRKLKLIRKL